VNDNIWPNIIAILFGYILWAFIAALILVGLVWFSLLMAILVTSLKLIKILFEGECSNLLKYLIISSTLY
jgi:hypothetical protein